MAKSSKEFKPLNPIEKYFNVITPYHYYFFFFLFLSKLPMFWHVLNLIFLSPPMHYSCSKVAILRDNSNSTDTCPCEEPSWDRSVFTETMQTKFNLTCDRKWLISFGHSMAYVGNLIGSFLFGFLSDRYGRLTTFTLSCLVLSIAGCLVSVMPSAGLFIFMRCIEGIGVGGCIVTTYVLCVEFCSLRNREVVTALFHLPLNVSHIAISGISYLLRHCDEFQLALSIPMFLFIGMRWLTMESPKWLMDNDNIDKAAMVMEKISKFNKSPPQSFKEEMEAFHSHQGVDVRRKVKFWQIFKHRRLTINLLCMSFMYFVCGMGYYGVSQYIGNMSGNIHVNVAISGSLLIPGTLAAVFLLKILSRRTFLMCTNIFSGVFMICVICIPPYMTWLRVVVACICNTFFFMSFIIVFLFGVELFPTSIRNSVLGFLSVLARLGQIIAPPVNALSQTTAGAIFGTLAVIGAIVCIPLPETKNVELPSSLEDSKSMTQKGLASTEEPVVIGNAVNT